MTKSLARRRTRSRTAGAVLAVRRLWAALERMFGGGNTCDRCERPMLDFRERDGERYCILCVAEQRAAQFTPIASPELAGCAAVLRALLLELENLSVAHCAAHDREHIQHLVGMCLDIVWWITPPNLRIPNALVIDEARVRAQLAAYEGRWGRTTGVRRFTGTFALWRTMQLRAARYADLAEVDRRHAALQRQTAAR